MTTQPELGGRVPQWTLADRLRKARVDADLTVKELSARAGISEKTINNYEADRHAPRRPSLIAWALATGIDLEWLETGNAPQPGDGPGGELSGRRDSNSQHSAWNVDHSAAIIPLRAA